MKKTDKFLRYWRVSQAFRCVPNKIQSAFDIGCDDGYLLNRLDDGYMRLGGCDPRLTAIAASPRFTLFNGGFPSALINSSNKEKYDVIFALAVFEHFSEADLYQSSRQIAQMLSENGLLIVTVPHPFVDSILNVLMFFNLVDGQALEEHHGFKPNTLADIFSGNLKLVTKRTFQLGLNNLFIFKKI